MKYVVNYRGENVIPRIVIGDRMRIDKNVAMILKTEHKEGLEKQRVVALINMEAIKEIVEEPE